LGGDMSYVITDRCQIGKMGVLRTTSGVIYRCPFVK